MQMDSSYESSVAIEARLQSISPIANATYDGPENGDLSLSELSLSEKPLSAGPSQPFSLLARPSQPAKPEVLDSEDHAEIAGNETEVVEDDESWKNERDERLKQDLFVLRKLNSGLAVYNDALSDTRSSAERVAEQLKQTNALLDKYIDILAKSEATTRLIFDERWHGADNDEATLGRLEREAEEKVRREAEERALSEQREKERLEREERERRERAEKERIEAEKREKLAIRAGYGSVRGVRGTRASARARGVATSRAAFSSASHRGRTGSVSSVATSGGRSSRPASSASVRSTTSTASRSGVR